MKKEKIRGGVTLSRQRLSNSTPEKKPGMDVGTRWHAGHFRVTLCLIILAAGIALGFGQNGPIAQWYLQDGYVATRATIVKAPFWADALEPRPASADGDEAIAGWHVELKVGDHPFALAVALADLDPDNIYTQQGIVPDAKRFAVDSVHPVWFYDDNRKKQPETVALLQTVPSLLISRAVFNRFPTLMEAMVQESEVLIAPGILLALAALYLPFSFWGNRGANTAGSPFATRATWAIGACLVATGTYFITHEHPLAGSENGYTPAEIEITRAPLPQDRLTSYRGYRVLWRTWQVQAKLSAPDAKEFTIDVDGLDPRRTTWASRHSPDFSVFQPGAKLAVWQTGQYGSMLGNLGPMKPVVNWDAYLSRERWPEKYTLRDYAKDNPVAIVVIVAALLYALVLLLPLGGTRRSD